MLFDGVRVLGVFPDFLVLGVVFGVLVLGVVFGVLVLGVVFGVLVLGVDVGFLSLVDGLVLGVEFLLLSSVSLASLVLSCGVDVLVLPLLVVLLLASKSCLFRMSLFLVSKLCVGLLLT